MYKVSNLLYVLDKAFSLPPAASIHVVLVLNETCTYCQVVSDIGLIEFWNVLLKQTITAHHMLGLDSVLSFWDILIN